MKQPRYWLAGTLVACCLAISANAQFVTQVINSVAVGQITGLGTGVGTALGIAVGSAGGPVTNGGALGTPSSGTATNITGSSGITGTGTLTSGATGAGFTVALGTSTVTKAATTWTPTLGTQGGSSTLTLGAANYFQIGKLVISVMDITVTTANTGTGYISATVPVSDTGQGACAGREVNSTGVGIVGQTSAGTTFILTLSTGLTPIVTGYRLQVTCVTIAS